MRLHVDNLVSNPNEKGYYFLTDSKSLKLLQSEVEENQKIKIQTQFHISKTKYCGHNANTINKFFNHKLFSTLKKYNVTHFMVNVFYCTYHNITDNTVELVNLIKKLLISMPNTNILVTPSSDVLFHCLNKMNFLTQNKRFFLTNIYAETRIFKNNIFTEPINTSKKHFPKPFVKDGKAFFVLCGSIGYGIGSYDENNFLERFYSFLKDKKLKEVHVIFCNSLGTFKFPFVLNVSIDGVIYNMKLYTNKNYDQLSRDLNCDIHDMKRLKIIEHFDKIERDENGVLQTELSFG